MKGFLQGTLFKGGQQSYLISEQPGIFAFLYGMAAAHGTVSREGRMVTIVPELKICLHQTEKSLQAIFLIVR